MPPLVQISPLVASGQCRVDVASFIGWACNWQAAHPDKVRDIYLVPEQFTPAPVARNRVVKIAQERGVDLLVMIDDDMCVPVEFFAFAVEFLRKHAGPAVIGVPYCTQPGPEEAVLAFEWMTAESNVPSPRMKLERIRREDAARRKGVERVANLGTGCVAIRMDCFEKLRPPYFDYNYNEDHTIVTETEDCYFFRHCDEVGIPLYVSWEHWAGHAKTKIVQKPVALGRKEIGEFYMSQALSLLERERRPARRNGDYQSPRRPALVAEAADLVPPDVPGWMDFPELYARMVAEAKDGAAFVEVGCWLGQSAITMARLIERSGKRIRFEVVDTFRGSAGELQHAEVVNQHGGSVRSAFLANLHRYGVAHLITVQDKESGAAARSYHDASFDFVFIDAEHTYDAVRRDITLWLPKVRRGGILAGHDVDFLEVKRAVEDLLPDYETVGRCWVWQMPAAPTASLKGSIRSVQRGREDFTVPDDVLAALPPDEK